MRVKPFAIALLVAIALSTSAINAFEWNPLVWICAKYPICQPDAAMASVPAQNVSRPLAEGKAPNYRAIVERFGSAVVGINTEGMAKNNFSDMPDPFGDDPFFDFFRGLPGFKGFVPRSEFVIRGQGSGFIIAKTGLILTNAHVVRNAAEVTVKLSDRREFKAKVLGSDKSTDVAVLKIAADNLPEVALGDASGLGVGDYVLAIGSPFGFEQSATAGIVSAKGRSLPGDVYVPFIQTDVAVNPGNSGGPLFDANGNVVGINSQIYSRTGGFQGVSFAIPINVALKVKDQILATGKVAHAKLGVTIQELDQALAETFKLARPEGALIANVEPDSSAAKAGIETGDIILKYNSQAILSSGDLPSLVSMGKPGEKVKLEVWRAGKRLERNAVLGETREKITPGEAGAGSMPHGKLGIAARPLTPEEKNALKLSYGLLVEEVTGRAARAGIQTGDIILSVNGSAIKSIEQIQSLLAKGGKRFALLIQRGEMKTFVPIELD